ncbi:MAG: hypothetical protein AAF388_06880 [Bacteroidota bacterium]
MEESQPNQRITPASDQKKKAGVAILISALTFGVICFFWVFLKENARTKASSVDVQSTFSGNTDKEYLRMKGKVLRRYAPTSSPILPDIELELPNHLENEREIFQAANEMGQNTVAHSPARKGVSIHTTLAITSLGSRYPLDSLEINMAVDGKQLKTAYQGSGTYGIYLSARDSLMFRKRKLAIIEKDGLELKRSYVKLGMSNSVFLE